MTTLNSLYRAMELVKEMAPKLQELNNILSELDRQPIDENCKEKLDCLYRDLNDAELLEEIGETLSEAREEYYQSEEYLNNEEYEYDPEDYDPNDWDEDEDLYEKYYGDDEDDSYDEVYEMIKPEYINKEGE